MVQLKSFKYIENSEINSNSGSDLENTQTIPSRSSSTVSNISSIVSGGNLTVGGDETNSTAQSEATNLAPNSQPHAVNEDESTTTLSSNEELQVVNHDIIEEEDEDEDSCSSAAITTINLEASASTSAKNDQKPQQQQQQHQVSLHIQQPTINQAAAIDIQTNTIDRAGAAIPLSPRANRQQTSQIKSGGFGSPIIKPLIHSMSSGNLMNRYGTERIDSVSQYSFVQRNTQQNNNFEIRWHNINLYASKRKPLSSFITENRIYKLLTGSDSKTVPINNQSIKDTTFSEQQQTKSPQIASKVIHSPSLSSHRMVLSSPSLATKTFKTTMTTSLSDLNQIKMQQKFQKENIGASIDWSSVDLTKQILNNVSGSVVSGQLTAILGPSGVGKTTLLNSLTGRNTLEGTGRVLLLGGRSNTKRMSVVTVPQQDVLPGKLTCLEDLQFTSRLKNPQRNFDHQRNINRIVTHLFMEKFLHTRIDKLSGGEQRRLSIGRELLNSPDIMILDEPTSGLDANTCKKIILSLRDIVIHSDNILDRPMAVIVTIHQPQQEVFNLFHRVYVMAQGGRAVYEGPPTSLLSTLLEQSSISKVCPIDQLNENPAIVAIEAASGEYGPNVIEELALHHEQQMYEDYANSIANGSEFGGAGGTPYSTPKFSLSRHHVGMSSPRSPFSATPRFGLRQHRAASLTGPNQMFKMDSIASLSGPAKQTTPILPAKSRILQQHYKLDNLSSVTTLSYASTYDAELPELNTHLKVDKRLRRSVVMKSHFWSHTYTLMQRCWLLTIRDMFLMSIRVLGFLLVAAGMVQIFRHALDPNEHQCPMYQSEVDDFRQFIADTKNRLLNISTQLKQASSTHLFFFHLGLCTTIVTSALAGLIFPLQMRMFLREYKNGWYSPSSFITSLTFAELPVDIIGPTLTLLIAYPLCHQPESAYYWREAGYIFVMVLSSIICKSQAQVVGAFLMDSVENSVFISCVVVTVPALLSGIAVRISNMNWFLQLLSYGSFLRYAFESLFLFRYGYDMCPCDKNLVYGYPVNTTTDAIPDNLNKMVNGILKLNEPTLESNGTIDNNNVTTSLISVAAGESEDEQDVGNNLFVRFLRLVTGSSNLFVPKPEDLGDCSTYRSLYLIDMGIEDRILLKWVSIMIFIFIVSRIITYFAIKAVIKLR